MDALALAIQLRDDLLAQLRNDPLFRAYLHAHEIVSLQTSNESATRRFSPGVLRLFRAMLHAGRKDSGAILCIRSRLLGRGLGTMGHRSRVQTEVDGPEQGYLLNADTKIVSTPLKLVWGVCSAGSGPVDSCNVCNTNPPTEKCEWSVQKR
jgi:hypothetical protein